MCGGVGVGKVNWDVAVLAAIYAPNTMRWKRPVGFCKGPRQQPVRALEAFSNWGTEMSKELVIKLCRQHWSLVLHIIRKVIVTNLLP